MMGFVFTAQGISDDVEKKCCDQMMKRMVVRGDFEQNIRTGQV